MLRVLNARAKLCILRTQRQLKAYHDCKGNTDQSYQPPALPSHYLTTGTVYLHWPYCSHRCSYCNFVKFVPRPSSSWTFPDDVLQEALVQEVRQQLQHSHICQVTSVFFGGGTPSLAPPSMVQKVLEAIGEVSGLAQDAEVTLEVNPTALETHKLHQFRCAGINRLSIGVQALSAGCLALLGRGHSVDEAEACVCEASRLFPGRVSVDLIYGRPGQTTHSVVEELRRLLSMCDHHVSLYQLTLEPGTKLYHQVQAGLVTVPGSEELADMYEAAVSVLLDSGFHRYEVSNFARGCRAESGHNKSYWEGVQYVGVGPGAHGRVVPITMTKQGAARGSEQHRNREVMQNRERDSRKRSSTADEERASKQGKAVKGKTGVKTLSLRTVCLREARVNAADPASWLMEVRRKGDGVRKVTHQSSLDMASEYLASGLRTRRGVTEARWSALLPPTLSLAQVFGETTPALQRDGLVHLSPHGLSMTHAGIMVLDTVLPYLYNILYETVQ